MGAAYSNLDSHTYRANMLTHWNISPAFWIVSSYFQPDRVLSVFAVAKLDKSYLFLEIDLLQKEKERKKI